MDPAEAQQLRQLRERIALLSPDRPFQNLEIIATLGIGGFGRVELVSFNYTTHRSSLLDLKVTNAPTSMPTVVVFLRRSKT